MLKFQTLLAALLLGLLPITSSLLTAQRSSLFHRAQELDSLYNSLDAGNQSAAEDFFGILRTLYNDGGGLDRSTIRTDFSGNAYIGRKVDNVFAELELRDDNRGLLIDDLYGRRDSLLRVATSEGESYCSFRIETTGNCEIATELRDLATAPTEEALRQLRKATENEALRDRLQGLEADIYGINRELEREETISETILQLNAEAGSSLPFGGTQAGSVRPVPLIVQASGPTSLQQSVLDGASKWIAERMREELSIAFFDRFEGWVENENIRVLFPNTFNAIGNSMTVDYSLMLQVFKTAFEKDLQILPFAMGDYLRLEINDSEGIVANNNAILAAYDSLRVVQGKQDSILTAQRLVQDRVNGLKSAQKRGEEIDLEELESAELDLLLADIDVDLELGLGNFFGERLLEKAEQNAEQNGRILKYVLFTMDAINELRQGTHPSDLLGLMTNRVDELFPQSSNLKPALLVMDVISRSLISLDRESGTVWLKSEELEKLRRNAQLRDFFFGLVYQEIRQSMRRNRSSLNDEMKAIAMDQTGGGLTLPAYEYARDADYAIRSALRYNNLAFIGKSRAEAETMTTTMIENSFSDVDDRVKTSIRAAILDLHRRLQPIARNNPEFEIEKYRAIQNERAAARRKMDAELEQLAAASDSEDLEDWKETARYCLNLDQGVDEELEILPANAYLSKIAYNLEGYYGFFLEDDSLSEKLTSTVLDAAPAFVVEKIYKDRILPEVEAARQAVFKDIHQSLVRADSMAIIQRAILEVPAVRPLQLKLDRLGKHQEFIDDLLLQDPRAFGNLVSDFIGFADRFDVLQADFRSLKKENQANLGSTSFVFLLKNSLDLLQQVFEIALPEDQEELTTVNLLTTNVLDAYTGVLEEDYDAVLMNIIPVANSLVDLRYESLILDAGENRIVVDSLRGRQADSQLKLQEIFRYGAFLAAVAESQSSEEIKNAIRAIALPAGSYSIKRRAISNISLNAYPGITGGGELASGNGINSWGGNFGFTAPIGLAFSWGYRSKIDSERYLFDRKYQRQVDKSPILPDEKFLNGSSGSLFFPLIDLGALVLFRLDSATEPLPEDVGFQQVFSPGIIYAHGFNNLPLSLMAGMQVSPQLRKFGEERANSFRFNLGLTVDLPMINFHTRRVPRKARR